MSELINIAEILGENVFDDETMQERMPKKVYKALKKMIEEGKISNAAGKQVFEVLLTQENADPAKIVEEKGLAQISDDSALQAVVDQVCEANQKSIQDYKNGKTNELGYLTGQCMKATMGKGKPAKMEGWLLE